MKSMAYCKSLMMKIGRIGAKISYFASSELGSGFRIRVGDIYFYDTSKSPPNITCPPQSFKSEEALCV